MAERWKALAHPAVARLLDAFVDGEDVWLAFEFVEGEPVDDVLIRARRLDLDQAQGRLGPVCHAVQSAHAAGLVHGNILSSKVLVTKEGRSLLTGFLLPGEAGTVGASAQRDVDMLGILLRRLLTGSAQSSLGGAQPDGLSPQAQALLAKATHPELAKRYASADELSRALAAAATAEKGAVATA